MRYYLDNLLRENLLALVKLNMALETDVLSWELFIASKILVFIFFYKRIEYILEYYKL